MTYMHSPQDSAQAAILWAKVGLVTLLGVAIPLGIPRPYVPLDPLVSYPPRKLYSLIDNLVEPGTRTQSRANRFVIFTRCSLLP